MARGGGLASQRVSRSAGQQVSLAADLCSPGFLNDSFLRRHGLDRFSLATHHPLGQLFGKHLCFQ